MKRRQVLALGAAAGAGALVSSLVDGKEPQPTSNLGQYEASITDQDRRFRFALNRAMLRLRMRGKLTRQQFRDFRAATFNTFEYSRDNYAGAFVQHVRRDINKASSGAFDDVLEAAKLLVDAVIRWLVEQWDSIVNSLMGNLKALQLAVDEDNA